MDTPFLQIFLRDLMLAPKRNKKRIIFWNSTPVLCCHDKTYQNITETKNNHCDSSTDLTIVCTYLNNLWPCMKLAVRYVLKNWRITIDLSLCVTLSCAVWEECKWWIFNTRDLWEGLSSQVVILKICQFNFVRQKCQSFWVLNIIF